MISIFCSVVFTLLFINSAMLAMSPEEQACEAIFNSTIIDNECCESMILLEDSSKSSSCGHSSEEGEPTCEDMKCLLEEDGILVDDKISEEKAKEMVDQWEKENPNEKTMVDRVRRECLDGKYLKYYDGDCEPLKFYSCLFINAILECQEWKKDEQCNTMKEYMQKCKKSLDNK